MKLQTIVIIVVVGAVFIGLFLLGSSRNAGTTASVQGVETTSAKSVLTASETFYDFGMISMKNGNVTKEFTFTNPSNADIMLSKVLTSCMCTAAFIVRMDGTTKGPFGMAGHGGSFSPANEIIKAGESRILRVVYDPNAHGPAGVGKIDRFITLTDSSGATLQFEIRGTVTP